MANKNEKASIPTHTQTTDFVTRDEHRTLTEQIVILQKTIDRHYELLEDMVEEQNRKSNETRERVGKVELALSEIVETFKDVGARFTRQTKELQSVLKETVEQEIEPVAKQMEKFTQKPSKLIHHVVEKRQRGLFARLFKRR